MRYLVTGGAGFIGSNTVDELVRRGHDVVVLDDLSAGKAANLANVRSKIKLIQDSVTNLDALREACRGVDYVIHLAAQTSVPRSVKDPIETNLINVNGTLNVLVAARDAKVKRIVFASSCAVYGKTSVLPIRESASLAPISPYGVSKQVGEAYGRVENPKGATGFYVVSDGGTNPYRYHVHAPSFVNISALGTMCKGYKVADVVIILGSIDIVLGELDR